MGQRRRRDVFSVVDVLVDSQGGIVLSLSAHRRLVRRAKDLEDALKLKPAQEEQADSEDMSDVSARANARQRSGGAASIPPPRGEGTSPPRPGG